MLRHIRRFFTIPPPPIPRPTPHDDAKLELGYQDVYLIECGLLDEDQPTECAHYRCKAILTEMRQEARNWTRWEREEVAHMLLAMQEEKENEDGK